MGRKFVRRLEVLREYGNYNQSKMKLNSVFLKKVGCLCGVVFVLFFNNGLSAQIVYTDIPDATPNATYSLDLNNDAVVDFMIYFGGSTGTVGAMCAPQNSNAYSGNLVGGVHLPWALAASSSICDSLATWYDASNPGTLGLGTSVGYWPGATDKYLGLKLIVGTNTYYGWVRLDVFATATSFTVKDYAYESTPNACIEAGQTVLGMNEYSSGHIVSISPNPFVSSTTIQAIGNFKDATLTVYNAYGQPLKQVTAISGETVSLSRDNLPSGVYFIGLTEENKSSAVVKLIITD